MTSVTWPEVRASRTFLRVLALFSYYSRSTKCSTVVQVPWLPEVTSLLVIFSYTCYFFFLVHDVIKHFIFPVLFSRTFSNRNVWNTTRTMVGFLRSFITLTMNTHAAFVNVQQMKYVIGSGKLYIWNNMQKKIKTKCINALFINLIIPMHILIM
jgi:hypothetical protein